MSVFLYVAPWQNPSDLASQTVQLPKAYEQMSLAIQRNATRLWIVNVGDLKPLEREAEWFLSYGYDSSVWNADNLDTYVSRWAQRDFGLEEADASIVTSVVANLTRFNARRTPELLAPETYSLIYYRECVFLPSEPVINTH